MRITQQNITQNNISMLKSQLTPSDAKAMIGNVIEGKITAINDNQFATLSTGDKQLNVNINGLNLQENQIVNLKITGFKDGALIAKLVGSPVSTESKNSLTDMLSKLGISDQTENVTILDAMKTANIPITKDNFQMMRQGMVEVKALVSELASTGQLPLENDLEMPIKALALKIIQQNAGANPDAKAISLSRATDGTSSGAITSSPPSSTIISNLIETPTGTPTGTTTGTLTGTLAGIPTGTPTGTPAGTTTDIVSSTTMNATTEVVEASSTSPEDLTHAKKADSELLSKTIQYAFDKEGASLKQGIQAMLGQFDYKQESLILKNDLPITLKNIFLAYDALSDEGGITNRFAEVLKGLESVPFSKEAILNIITSLTSEVPQEEKLEALIDAIRKEMPDSELKQGLERELTVIKESTLMSKTLNDQMMFMQMPIPINEQIQNVEIYYKKNKTKPNPDDLTLLVALKTFNFGEVRCIVHKQAQTFSLHFSFVDEASMAYYESKKELLTEALESHKDKQFSLTFAVKSNHPEFQMNEDSHFESFGFDLKV